MHPGCLCLRTKNAVFNTHKEFNCDVECSVEPVSRLGTGTRSDGWRVVWTPGGLSGAQPVHLHDIILTHHILADEPTPFALARHAAHPGMSTHMHARSHARTHARIRARMHARMYAQAFAHCFTDALQMNQLQDSLPSQGHIGGLWMVTGILEVVPDSQAVGLGLAGVWGVG